MIDCLKIWIYSIKFHLQELYSNIANNFQEIRHGYHVRSPVTMSRSEAAVIKELIKQIASSY